MLISKFKNADIEQEILKVEEKYDVVLPQQYKDFLCKYNGGHTPKTKFKVGKISSDIRAFYGLGEVPFSFHTLDMKEWIENKLLPIACDSFGNYILIGLSNEGYGKIYFSNHEAGNKRDCIGDDLISFLKHCKSDKICEAAKKSIKEREAALIAKGRGSIITDDLRKMWQDEIDKYGNMIQEKVEINY